LENVDEKLLSLEIRNEIEKLIKEYEEKYNIHVFYAVDTGSRSIGVSVDTSDFDLNGFFIPHKYEYIRISRKSPEIIAKTHKKFKVGEREYEIDFQLWDVMHWLRQKVEKNLVSCDYWLISPLVYRENKELTNQIRELILPPFYDYWGKFKNNMDQCKKAIMGEGCQNKRLMNCLIYATQFLHIWLFKEMPVFNIFEQMDTFKSRKDRVIVDEKFLTEKEWENLLQCFEFIEVCYEEKKKGHKSLTKLIPGEIATFSKMLDDKFNPKKKREDLVNNFNTENCQTIFNKILNYYQ
jgi:predicted nucleotidyltransferase